MGLISRTHHNSNGKDPEAASAVGSTTSASTSGSRYDENLKKTKHVHHKHKSPWFPGSLTSLLLAVSCGVLFLLYQTAHLSVRVRKDLEDSGAQVLVPELVQVPSAIQSVSQASQIQKSPFAYAFFLGGIPTIHNGTTTTASGYRGLLYNILVSVHMLRRTGSKADMVLMVHMAEPHSTLPSADLDMIRDLDIMLQYVPPTVPSFPNGLATLALEKFHILSWTQYRRVLYLNPEVMPLCNLDYLMQLSLGTRGPLAENVLVSIADQPASTSIFVVAPQRGHYQGLLVIPNRNPRRQWTFEGANTDAGLLYHWVRFVRQRYSMIVGKSIYTQLAPGRSGSDSQVASSRALLGKHSCLPANAEHSQGAQFYADPRVKAIASPFGIAPYRDLVQWQHFSHPPWEYRKAPHPQLEVTTARRFWFQTLRYLDATHHWNLGLAVPSDQQPAVVPEADEEWKENIHAETPTWKYSPPQQTRADAVESQRYPIWSTKLQALQLWGCCTVRRTHQGTEMATTPDHLAKSRPGSS